MYNIIALIGKSGAGKDYILGACTAKFPRWHRIVSYTTRPRRDNEIDGIDYHFISEEEFMEKVNNHEMVEYTQFNSWLYGTAYDCLRDGAVNIGVFNPTGVKSLLMRQEHDMEKLKSPFMNIWIFQIHASDNTRIKRLLDRGQDIEEIQRRTEADKKDFSNLNFDYQNIRNEDIPIEEIVDFIRESLPRGQIVLRDLT
jgi:guanylate kinase